jgi:hypothetical protein
VTLFCIVVLFMRIITCSFEVLTKILSLPQDLWRWLWAWRRRWWRDRSQIVAPACQEICQPFKNRWWYLRLHQTGSRILTNCCQPTNPTLAMLSCLEPSCHADGHSDSMAVWMPMLFSRFVRLVAHSRNCEALRLPALWFLLYALLLVQCALKSWLHLSLIRKLGVSSLVKVITTRDNLRLYQVLLA